MIDSNIEKSQSYASYLKKKNLNYENKDVELRD